MSTSALEQIPLDDNQPSIEAPSGGVVVEDASPFETAYIDLNAYANRWTAELEQVARAVRRSNFLCRQPLSPLSPCPHFLCVLAALH